jgi:hypothetical protein
VDEIFADARVHMIELTRSLFLEGLTLIESAEGLLVYQGGVDAKTHAWWEALSSEEKQQAAVEARAYEQLSAAEQDALWNEGADTLDDGGRRA